MSDDHARQAISAYDSDIIQTPNIDRLANEGITFLNCFCTNSICAPSRAVILTGKHSHINGIIDNRASFDGSQQTFPKLFQKNGYQTAMIGKWHLKSDPTGFDYWNILPGQGDYYNPVLIEMGEKKQHDGYVTDIITKMGIDWLGKRDPEKPFLLMLQHKAPHRTWMPRLDHINLYDSMYFLEPITFYDDYASRGSAAREQEMEIGSDMLLEYDLKVVSPNQEVRRDGTNRMSPEQLDEWDRKYAAKNSAFLANPPIGKELLEWKFQRYMQDYLATIASVDEGIGEILDWLDENELAQNTVVIYTSDQGFYLGEHGWFDKRFMYEESLGMPLLIRYPGVAQAYARNDDLIMNLDFAPTFLDLAGIKIPDDMQGLSFKKLLTYDSGPIREVIYYHYFEYPAVHSVKRHYGIRSNQYKMIHFYYDDDYWELYDLLFDPFEQNNIYDDPANDSIKTVLHEQLSKLRKQYDVPSTEEELESAISNIEHLAVGKTAIMQNTPSPKYFASPDILTNGEINQLSLFSMGDRTRWYGFHGNDFIVQIDLGDIQTIEELGIRFLKNENDWIFLPETVHFYISENGVGWAELSLKEQEIISEIYDSYIYQFNSEEYGGSGRYIKIEAENIGTCPEGHPGEGGKAWLFVDEVIIN